LRLDITARKKAEAEATEAKALIVDIVETLPNGVIAYDRNGNILLHNKVVEDIFKQFALEAKIGRRRQDIIAFGKESELFSSEGAATADFKAEDCCLTHIQLLPNGHWIQVQNRRSPSGTLVSIQTDVTELKQAELKIALQVQHDSLTGLFTRHALFERLSECCQLSRDPIQTCALVLIDLDHFKAINDSMGHDAGDALLRYAAKLFQSSIRQSDMAARIGGDEFAILLHGAHSDADVKRAMEMLKEALARPARIGQKSIIPTASMGVAIFPRDGSTPEELLKSADLALYQCKKESRGDYRIFNLAMRRQRMRRALLTDKLREALSRDEFSIMLQPQRDMSSGRHTGFESLARWKLGRRWISPQELISLAEEAGLVTQLSYQLIEKALAMMARLKSAGLQPGVVGINVVAAQLHEPNFVRNLMKLLRKYSILPDEVEIEVTENVILDRAADSIERVLHKLYDRGFSIALDDFGMGYASLTHLKRFPLKRLKIDRSFVSGVIEAKDDHVIVCAIISLAHSLGLQVVAEGIETPQQQQELLNLGCDFAQGYLIGRPMDEGGASCYLNSDCHNLVQSRVMRNKLMKFNKFANHGEPICEARTAEGNNV
jgi:diguanylate cyclase (GGDEF)-like protein